MTTRADRTALAYQALAATRMEMIKKLSAEKADLLKTLLYAREEILNPGNARLYGADILGMIDTVVASTGGQK